MSARRIPTESPVFVNHPSTLAALTLLLVLLLSGSTRIAFAEATWVEISAPTRLGHAAVYDPVRDRMLVFGGQQGCLLHDEVLALAVAGTPEWTEVATAGDGPSARVGHTMTYDPVRDRVVVIGGHDGAIRNDVWTLSLAATPSWSLITPAGAPPSPRSGHSAIYDPIGDRILIFGGAAPGAANDVWELALGGEPTWTQLAPSGTPPPNRADHSAIYDPVRRQMLVFGGAPYPYRNDLWALALDGSPAWSEITPPGEQPEPRGEHTTLYDPVRDRMILLGGTNFPNDFGTHDAWALPLAEGASWQALPSHSRWDHAAVYDPVRDCVIVHGGHRGIIGSFGSQEDNGTWGLFLATSQWRSYFAGGGPVLSAHTAVYDPVGNRMIVFGGLAWAFIIDISPVGIAWSYSLGESPGWSYLSDIGPRADHSAILDPVRRRMLVFGGDTYYGPRLNDVLAMSLETTQWSVVSAIGSPPAPRRAHSAIYDPVRDRMLIFGGVDAIVGYPGPRFNDVWELALSGEIRWSALAPLSTPPSPRENHTAIYDPVGDRMIIFGGSDASGLLNDLWALSLAGPVEWTPLTAAGTPPSPRATHTSVYDPMQERMLVFGGTYSAEVCALDLSDPSGAVAWVSVDPAGLPPSGRQDHSAIYDSAANRIVVYGGSCNSRFAPAVFGLEPGSVTSVADAPAMAGLSIHAVPNPSDRNIAITFTLPAAAPTVLELIDVTGRRLIERDLGTVGPGTRNVTLDHSQIAAGVYFVRLSQAGRAFSTKISLLHR